MASSGSREVLSANGNTTQLAIIGSIHVALSGTFGGGTAKLQVQDPAGNWVDVAGASWTAVVDTLISYPVGSRQEARINLAGATAPSLVVVMKGEEHHRNLA